MNKKESGILCPAFFLFFFIPFLLPSGLRSAVIDNEDTVVGYSAETDLSAADNVLMAVPSESGQAVQLNYNFATTSSYSQLTKLFSRVNLGDLAQSNVAIRIWIRGSGTNNTLRFRLTDADGDQLYRAISGITDTRAWSSLSFPLSSLTGVSLGNGQFDLFRVAQLELAIEKTGGGNGTLDIDKLEIYRMVATTGSSILLDGFEGGTGTKNALGGSTGTYTNDVNASISTVYDNSSGNAAIGNFALKITYNAGTRTSIDNAGFFSSPNGVNLTSSTHLEFYAKAANDNEAFQLTLGTSTEYQSINIGAVSKSWQKFSIPLSNYDQLITTKIAGRIGFTSDDQFVMVFTPNLSAAGAGIFWIDDIRFTAPAASSGTIRAVDDLEETVDPALTNWEVAYDSSSFASLSSITDGVDGRALRMTYNIQDGLYAVLVRKFFVNAGLADAVRLKYKLTGQLNGATALNNFQFNVIDSVGTRYQRTLSALAPTGGQWKSLTIPFKELSNVSGTTSLNLKKIKEIRLTLLKSEGGKGLFAVDDLEVLTAPKLAVGEQDRLIQLLSADNNPFSPNGDGVKDVITFSFILKENARARFRIYSSDGRVIKEFNSTVAAGSSSFIWDGNDADSGRVKNGLYFYQLKADAGASGNSDKETGVVAVLR